jgi:manganese/zinc/iron transport system substrate-binding protein
MQRLLTILLTTLLFACNGGQNEEDNPPRGLKIVATTGMIADLVGEIAGAQAEVIGLMGPGVDPHLFQASQGDIRFLARADIIFYNGLHLEGKMTNILAKMGRRQKVIAIGEAIDKSLIIRPDASAYAFDPHIWFDVSLWRQTIPMVVRSLAEADPQHAELYARRGEKYAAELDSLHRWVATEIATIPAEQRILITAHDAFTYFGRAYGIEVRGLQGVSTVAEFGLRDVSDLVELIASRRIKAIFVETSVSEKAVLAVQNGVADRGWQTQIGGRLYSDAMGGSASGADTYVGMVRSNVTTIVRALR